MRPCGQRTFDEALYQRPPNIVDPDGDLAGRRQRELDRRERIERVRADRREHETLGNLDGRERASRERRPPQVPLGVEKLEGDRLDRRPPFRGGDVENFAQHGNGGPVAALRVFGEPDESEVAITARVEERGGRIDRANGSGARRRARLEPNGPERNRRVDNEQAVPASVIRNFTSGPSIFCPTPPAARSFPRTTRSATVMPPSRFASAPTLSTTVGDARDMRDALDMGWERPVPTLYLTAEFDTLLPLEGMRDLLARTPEPRNGVVLLRSDHFHFCDRAEETHDMFKVMGPMIAGAAGEGAPDMTGLFASMKASSELCPGAHGYAMTCGLGLAHMDAHLRGVADAAALLDEDLVQVMASRGIAVGPL